VSITSADAELVAPRIDVTGADVMDAGPWFLRHLRMLRTARPGIESTLVGGGPPRADYARLATGPTRGTSGSSPITICPRKTTAATRVVPPSVTQAEAFGLVVLEGTAPGPAPVGSDPPGARDLVAGAARGGRLR
jgi:hypothetical protein